jgi:hypothetical protein
VIEMSRFTSAFGEMASWPRFATLCSIALVTPVHRLRSVDFGLNAMTELRTEGGFLVGRPLS